ncbi:hypothetical protein [Nocardioides sp.]|uniref:hypothetical protein n=1 Tax=Nocardioides sp. TaxID=35761 RepID=UPI00286B5BBC|nr:hypothetical protein [Nocardioides sp.]
MIGRVAAAVVAAGLVAGLGYGPVLHYLEPAGAASILDVRVVDDPFAAPRLPAWPRGAVDSSRGLVDLRLTESVEPPALPITFADAQEALDAPATVTVVAEPRNRAIPGVGVELTASDVEDLAALDEPGRSAVVRMLTAADGAALSVFALGTGTAGRTLLVAGDSSGTRRALLDDFPAEEDLLRVWAQLRPDLSVLVPEGATLDDDGVYGPAATTGLPVPADRARRAEPGTRAWSQVVDQVVHDEIFAALDAGRPPVASALMAGRSPAGLLELDGGDSRLTPRGTAYAVAARAVQPGSRLMATRATGDLGARALARPDGGASVLVWNPRGARTVTLQLPDGDRFLRFEVEVAARSLTSVVLGDR